MICHGYCDRLPHQRKQCIFDGTQPARIDDIPRQRTSDLQREIQRLFLVRSGNPHRCRLSQRRVRRSGWRIATRLCMTESAVPFKAIEGCAPERNDIAVFTISPSTSARRLCIRFPQGPCAATPRPQWWNARGPGARIREIAGVDGIHGREIAHTREENGRFHNLCQRGMRASSTACRF